MRVLVLRSKKATHRLGRPSLVLPVRNAVSPHHYCRISTSKGRASALARAVTVWLGLGKTLRHLHGRLVVNLTCFLPLLSSGHASLMRQSLRTANSLAVLPAVRLAPAHRAAALRRPRKCADDWVPACTECLPRPWLIFSPGPELISPARRVRAGYCVCCFAERRTSIRDPIFRHRP